MLKRHAPSVIATSVPSNAYTPHGMSRVMPVRRPVTRTMASGAMRGPNRDLSSRRVTGFATYRINVGKRHRVLPRQIVGALANEGGLGREDFGRIDIRGDFSLVELPAELPAGAWQRLRDTRISGRLIDLSRDERPGSDDRSDRHAGKRR